MLISVSSVFLLSGGLLVLGVSTSARSLALGLISFSLGAGLMGWRLYSSWIFVSISLVFLGGMMIIFLYSLSLTPGGKSQSGGGLLSLIGFFFLVVVGPFAENIISEGHWSGQVINQSGFPVIFSLTGYLFFALLIVVKLTESFKGPLIKKF